MYAIYFRNLKGLCMLPILLGMVGPDSANAERKKTALVDIDQADSSLSESNSFKNNNRLVNK